MLLACRSVAWQWQDYCSPVEAAINHQRTPPVAVQEVEWSSLDAFAQWEWWERYTCNVNARRHRRHVDADYYVLLLLKRSTFSKVSRYAFRGFPNTVMGVPRHCLVAGCYLHAPQQTCRALFICMIREQTQLLCGVTGCHRVLMTAPPCMLLSWLLQAKALLSCCRVLSILAKREDLRMPSQHMHLPPAAGRGLLIVDAEAHGSAFRFATTHLDSPGGNGEGMSDIRAFLNHVREVQAQQARALSPAPCFVCVCRYAACHARLKEHGREQACCGLLHLSNSFRRMHAPLGCMHPCTAVVQPRTGEDHWTSGPMQIKQFSIVHVLCRSPGSCWDAAAARPSYSAI